MWFGFEKKNIKNGKEIKSKKKLKAKRMKIHSINLNNRNNLLDG
jgi:hypothetical protein